MINQQEGVETDSCHHSYKGKNGYVDHREMSQ